MIPPSALLNRTFRRIWLASLVSGTAATWTMNLMSPSGLFISLMASLALLPFFLCTLPAGALADAFNEVRILRLANLWLAGSAGTLAFLGWAGLLNPVLLLAGVFLLGVGSAINAPAWASLVPQVVTDKELPSALTLNGMQFNITSIVGPALPKDEVVAFWKLEKSGRGYTLAVSKLLVGQDQIKSLAVRPTIATGRQPWPRCATDDDKSLILVSRPNALHVVAPRLLSRLERGGASEPTAIAEVSPSLFAR